MKNAGFFLIVALMVSAPGLAIAQNSPNPAPAIQSATPNYATQQDAQNIARRAVAPVKKELKGLADHESFLNGKVNQLSNQQVGIATRQDKAIYDANATARTAQKTGNDLTARVGLYATVATIIGVIVITLGAFGFYRLHKGQQNIVKIREVVIINPDEAYLSNLWQSSEGKPAEERVIHFTQRLTKNPTRGNDLEGDVSGFTAVFEKNSTFPTIRYKGGRRLLLKDVSREAANVLRGRVTEEAAKEVKEPSMPISAVPSSHAIRSSAA